MSKTIAGNNNALFITLSPLNDPPIYSQKNPPHQRTRKPPFFCQPPFKTSLSYSSSLPVNSRHLSNNMLPVALFPNFQIPVTTGDCPLLRFSIGERHRGRSLSGQNNISLYRPSLKPTTDPVRLWTDCGNMLLPLSESSPCGELDSAGDVQKARLEQSVIPSHDSNDRVNDTAS